MIAFTTPSSSPSNLFLVLSKSLAAGGFVTSADVPISDLSSDHFSMRVPGHLLFLSTLWSGPFSG